MGIGDPRGGHHSFGRGSGRSEGDVVVDSIVEQHRFLRDDPEEIAQIGESVVFDVDPIQQNLSLLQIVKARQQIDQRTLPAPAGAYQRDHFPFFNCKVHLVQHHAIGFRVAETHLAVFDRTFKTIDRAGIGGIGDAQRCRQYLLDPLDGGHSLADVVAGIGEFFGRFDQTIEREQKREKGRHLQIAHLYPVVAVVDQHGDGSDAQKLGQGTRQIAPPQQVDQQTAVAVVGPVEFIGQKALRAEALDDAKPPEPFFGLRYQIPELFLYRSRLSFQHLADAPDDQPYEEEQTEHEQGQ